MKRRTTSPVKRLVRAALCIALTSVMLPDATMAQTVPNLGEKVCALWEAVADRSKQDPNLREQESMIEWWAMGYLKGLATQYAASEKKPNPLLKLRPNEELEWMRTYCRINPKSNISEAVTKLIVELESRP